MKRIALALSALLLGTNLACSIPAKADPFSEDESHRFNDRHRNFMDSLGEAGERMRHDHDYANVQTSQRHHADQQSIQDGTQAVSRQAFEQSQMQALQSGGRYNGNSSYGVNGVGGSYGTGIGGFGFGIGGFGIGPGSTPQNTPQNQATVGVTPGEGASASNGTEAPAAVTDHSDHFTNNHFTGSGSGSQSNPHDWNLPARSTENLYYKTTNGMNRVRRSNTVEPLKGGSFQLPPSQSNRQVQDKSIDKSAEKN